MDTAILPEWTLADYQVEKSLALSAKAGGPRPSRKLFSFAKSSSSLLSTSIKKP